MAPMISNSITKDEQIEISKKDSIMKKINLYNLRKYIEKNFEYVGKDFSKKVREVYYDKKSQKTIYGTTTLEEREELAKKE